LGAGGGDSVATGDICAEEGLEMPAISPQTRAGLLEFVSLVNQGVMNPLDVPSVFTDLSALQRTFELLAADPLIDIIVLHVSAEFFPRILGHRIAELGECISNVTQKGGKPIVLAVTDEGKTDAPEKYVGELVAAGMTAYTSLRRACRALRRFASYHEFIAESGREASRPTAGTWHDRSNSG